MLIGVLSTRERERDGDENEGDEDGGVSGEGFLVLLGFVAERRDKVRESESEGEGVSRQHVPST